MFLQILTFKKEDKYIIDVPVTGTHSASKNYVENNFFSDLSNCELIKPDKMYNELASNFSNILDKHAPVVEIGAFCNTCTLLPVISEGHAWTSIET